MLKTIPALLTPDLLQSLAAMGHGDRLVIADRNFPAYSIGTRVHPLSGADTTAAAAAVLRLFPVDDFVAPAAFRMIPEGGDPDDGFEAHDAFAAALRVAENRDVAVAALPRTAFYDLARGAYAVVATSDVRPYSCFAVTKGVVTD